MQSAVSIVPVAQKSKLIFVQRAEVNSRELMDLSNPEVRKLVDDLCEQYKRIH